VYVCVYVPFLVAVEASLYSISSSLLWNVCALCMLASIANITCLTKMRKNAVYYKPIKLK